MRFLSIDFAALPRRPFAAWLVLAAGAMVLALAADRYADLSDEAEQLDGQVARLKRKASSTQTARGRSELAARERAQQHESDLLGQVSGADWAAPLQAVESAIDEDVALVAMSQEFSARRLRISLEARKIDDALAFAERLRASGRFEEVVLTGHETKKSTGIEVLGLTFVLTWRPAA